MIILRYMSIEDLSGQSYEIEPSFEFMTVWFEVQQKFQDALAKHTFQTPHWTKGTNPANLNPLAVFTVAESYDLMLQGRSEQLVLGVPILDPQVPVALTDREHSYFLLGRPGELGSRHIIHPEDYNRLFHGAEEPPVVDLLEKVRNYTVVPSAQRG